MGCNLIDWVTPSSNLLIPGGNFFPCFLAELLIDFSFWIIVETNMSQGLVTLNGYKWGTAPSLFHSCQIHGEVNILKVSIEMSALWIDLVDKSISLAGPSQCKSRLQGRQTWNQVGENHPKGGWVWPVRAAGGKERKHEWNPQQLLLKTELTIFKGSQWPLNHNSP